MQVYKLETCLNKHIYFKIKLKNVISSSSLIPP